MLITGARNPVRSPQIVAQPSPPPAEEGAPNGEPQARSETPPPGSAENGSEQAPPKERRAPASGQGDSIELIIDKLPRHALVKPIPVTISPLGDRVFIASTPDLDITVTGNSLSDALLLLKQQLESTYESLRGKASRQGRGAAIQTAARIHPRSSSVKNGQAVDGRLAKRRRVEVIDFAGNGGWGRFSGDLGFRFSAICAMGWRVISVGGRDGKATGRSSEGSVAAGAGGDHRSRPSAGAAGARDRLGVSRQRFASVCTPGAGSARLPTRLVAGLLILKHMHDLSDEVLCARWLENPYYQFFCGELSFCHQLPFDRSSLTHWRQRLGEEQLVALLQESLSVAHKTGALATRDLERVVVDTTVQPKAIAHPTDARLCHRALEKLVDLAQRNDVPLRQSYRRVAKRAAIMVGRYTHAHQFKRARRALKFLRIRLGRVIRDIRRKIAGDEGLEERFADLLALAHRVRFQDHRQRGPKVYALHAPEVECIGKGKARAPYEFGCKVSIATPATKPKGGQFVLHAKALHGNPFDGHTLGPVITDLEAADRGRDPPHPCRQGLSRPQSQREVPRLDHRPGAPRHRARSAAR